MKTLIVDMSPILYRFTFSSTTSASNTLNLQKNEDGLYDFDAYKDIFIFKTLEAVSAFKGRFDVDEVVLAIDSSPYWRKEFWSGYKHGRLSTDKSGVDWLKAKESQRELIKMLTESSTFKVINIKGAEGDDVGFVLAEELSTRGHEVIVKSLDHDWIYNLENPNVKYWETKHTVKDKECGWVEFNESEIKTLKFEHCMFGDRGDFLLPVVYYSQFSAEFKAYRPNATEIQAYPKRYEIDMAFQKSHGVSAYKHPRLGAKSFYKKMDKEGFTVQEFLDRDPIYQLNYDLNKKLALPSGIPDYIRELILDEYDNTPIVRDNGQLTEYFMKYGLINLVGKLLLF